MLTDGATPGTPWHSRRAAVLSTIFAATLLACTVQLQPRAESSLEPVIARTAILTADGYRLPLDRWGSGDPEAVVLALHGFTEHRGVFRGLAGALAEGGFAVYAYDQRGFGETRHRGIWPGEDILVDDARAAWQLLRERYPDRPIHLLGESMGGAIALLATTDPGAIEPDSMVLLAPAIWAREVMPWYQRTGLWLGDHLMPGLSFNPVTARRIADTQPTDDPAVAAEMRTDDRMLRDVRADMLVGMTDLMDAALHATEQLPEPALILYGLEDEIIPPEAACAMLERIASGAGPEPTVAVYPDGYHLLTRDLQAHLTRGDIVAWIGEQRRHLPSGRAMALAEARERVCAAREELFDFDPLGRITPERGAFRPRASTEPGQSTQRCGGQRSRPPCTVASQSAKGPDSSGCASAYSTVARR